MDSYIGVLKRKYEELEKAMEDLGKLIGTMEAEHRKSIESRDAVISEMIREKSVIKKKLDDCIRFNV